MNTAAWKNARNILCVRLDYLGDVLMMTPAIRALKRSAPGRRITLLSSPGGVAVARHIPEIDESIGYRAPWMKHGSLHEVEDDLAMLGVLREKEFDAAVIFTTYSQSSLPAAMMCYLAGIPLRIAHCRENPYHLLTDWLPETEPQQQIRHEVQRQLDLVAAVGCHVDDTRLSFHVNQADLDIARDHLAKLGISPRSRWIVLHPGASAASRRYPPEHWAAAARELADRLACPLVFTGDASEASLIETIRARVPESHTLAGKLDLGQLGALISLAPLLIANNTGPAHIAAALGTPVVDLYALTNPQHTPWQVASRVLFHDVSCRFCYKSACPQGHHDCLSRVLPSQVVAAALELLEVNCAGSAAAPCMAPLRLAPLSRL